MSNNHHHPEFIQLAELAEAYQSRGETKKAARFFVMAGESAAAHYDNKAALDYLTRALGCTPDREIGKRFHLLLTREKVLALLGRIDAWKEDLASLEFLAGILNSDEARAQVSARQAHHQLELGAHETAVSFAQTAVHLADNAHDSRTEAEARLTWGMAMLNQGNRDFALTQFSKALQLAQDIVDSRLEADCIRGIGLHFLNQGDLLQARFSYEQAQDLYEAIGDKRGQSYILNNLGHIAYDRKRFTTAEKYWTAALTLYEETGERIGIAMANVNLGAMYMDIGQYAQAEEATNRALKVSDEIQSVMGQAMGSLNLGLIKHYQGEHDAAIQYSEHAIALAQQMNSRRIEGYALIPLGHARFAQGKHLAAREAYWESLSIWHELKQPNLEMEQRAGLARTHLAAGEVVLAQAQVAQIMAHLEQHPELEGVESTFRVYETVIAVLREAGDGRSDQILQQACNLLQQRAADIPDHEARAAYLTNVKVHKDLLSLQKEAG